MAQIFTSTNPLSSPIRCTRLNERSVATPELFLGHATQIIPLLPSFFASFSKSRSSERSVSTNRRTISSGFVTRVTISALEGSAPNSRTKSFGGLINAMREPSLIPSFFGNGVPEYPDMIAVPNWLGMVYQSPRNFHQVKPTTLQIRMVTTEVISPIVHQDRCVV